MAERKYFFVSQGKTYSQEASGKYLWAPDDNVWHHQTMKEINTGDVILNYTNQSIAAISIAKGPAKKAPKPSEFATSTVWQTEGLKVDVDLYPLPWAVPKHSFIDYFYEKQNSYHGVVNYTKGINQIYLGEINNLMLEKVLQESEKFPSNESLIKKIRELISQPKSENVSFESEVLKGVSDMSIENEKIEHIKKYIKNKGFTYEGNLIENFYLSLKSKPFVILAGTSGTGKTRLAKLFAEGIGATVENEQFKLVPVRPDWSDSSDLFGHVNLNNEFVPGAILDFIKTASLPENSSKPYFLCLDEMNLARVEYYMSDFLSIIETRDFDRENHIKTDPLISLDKYGTDNYARDKYGTLGFPENLYIVGTVNMDETTFPFSKKVLDRANTIEFSLVDLVPKFDNISDPVQPQTEDNNFLKSKYLKITECKTEAIFVTDWCEKLAEINKVLEKASLHVGYRVRDEIIFYLLNNKEAGNLISNEDAFDNELMQKILPRIQGSSQSINDLLCSLFKICAGDFTGIQTANNSASEQMQKYLDDTSKSKVYKKSAEKIQFMTRRLEEDGFTSYWL